MKKLIAFSLSLGLAASASATLLKLELPIDFPATMVTEPAEGDDGRLNNFLKGELAKLREPNGDFIVFFTKNGEPVYRNKPEAVATPLPPQLGDIHFVEGENAVAWNVPGAVPAGLYIYRIRAGENVKTGKVFVAR